jgi:hypothetical protein
MIGADLNNGELVAAEPRHRIVRTHVFKQSCRDPLQQLVAAPMTEQIVDVFKAVQIETENRHRRIAALGQCQSLRQTVVKENPIRQTGEQIVVRHMPNPRLGFFALAQIAHRHHARGFIGMIDQLTDDLDRNSGAVGMKQLDFGGIGCLCRYAIADQQPAGLDREVVHMASHQLVQWPADQAAHGLVGIENSAIAMDHDAFESSLGQLPKTRLAGAQPRCLIHRARGQMLIDDGAAETERQYQNSYRGDGNRQQPRRKTRHAGGKTRVQH